MEEKWRKVSGCPSYSVSNHGRVRRDVAYNGRAGLIKPSTNNKGYRVINLWENNKQYSGLLHRVVAIVFVKNPTGLPHVNHDDGNKMNCRASNLKWTTEADNKDHAAKNGLMQRGEDRPNSKLTEDDVREIRKQYAAGGLTQAALGRYFGISRWTVQDILNRKSWGWLK